MSSILMRPSTASASSAIISPALTPAACPPKIVPVALSVIIRTNPFVAFNDKARPFPPNGNFETLMSIPCAFASFVLIQLLRVQRL